MTDRSGAAAPAGGQAVPAAGWWNRLRLFPAGARDGIERHTAFDRETRQSWRMLSAPCGTAAAAVLEREARIAARLGEAVAEVPLRVVRDGRVILLSAADSETLVAKGGLLLPPGRFLDLAVEAAAVLARMHGAGVIHRALRLSRFVVAADGTLRLRGFGRAMAGDMPEAPLLSPASGAAMAHAAPEQARRQNPASDARSDLYALGVVFYELLTGQRPLTARTTAQWLHAHVAVAAEPPGTLRPDLPAMVDTIVLKLLAKEPAGRYQSAAALHADLVRCRDDWQRTGDIAAFPPGRADIGPPAVLSGRLFGRAAEFGCLTAAFARVRHSGRAEGVLVTGEAGAGKSALVARLATHVIEAEARFAAGKSDLLLKDVPFAPFAGILRTVFAGLLSESAAGLEAARERLVATLAGYSGLVADLVPEAAFVLGSAAPLPEVSAALTQARMARVIVQTLGAVATPGTPLVVFLDDLHWADGASLAVVRALVETAPAHVLFVAACREDEMARTPALRAQLFPPPGDGATGVSGIGVSGLGASGMAVSEIAVPPLSEAETTEMVAAALSSPPADVAPLAATIHARTGGNAFYAGQFLRALVDGRVVVFSPQSQRWTWDGAQLSRQHTVAEFMQTRLSALPAPQQEFLRVLACAGGRCPAALFVRIAGDADAAPGPVAGALMAAGLVVRRDDDYHIAHDRVLEAAYALTPPDRRGREHARLAGLMMPAAGEVPEAMVFGIAAQIERADCSDVAAPRRLAFMRVLLAAARRARGTGAVQQAAGYLALARRLAPAGWQTGHPGLAFDLERLDCECLVALAAIDKAMPALAALLARAPDAVSRAGVLRLQAIVHTVRSDYEAAIAAALAGLELIGQALPRNPAPAACEAAYLRCREKLAALMPDGIGRLPEMSDPALRQALALLSTLISSQFVEGGLRFLHTARIVELTLDHGTTPESAYGLAWFGVLSAHYYGAHEAGFAWATAALALARRDGYEGQRTATLVALDQVSPWTQPLRTGLEHAREAARTGSAAGDLGMVCYARNHIASDLLVLGADLSATRAEIAAGLSATREIGYRDIEHILSAQLRLVEALLSGETDPAATVPRAEIVSIPTLFFVRYYEGIAALMFGAHDRALERLAEADRLSWSAPAHIDTACCALFHALAAARCAQGAPDTAAVAALLAARQAQFARWADLNPETFLSKRLLVEGAQAHLAGDDLTALRRFEAAAQAAGQAGLVHEQALAHEQAGLRCLAAGLRTAAQAHLAAARAGYRRWGADGKVRDLQARFPLLLESAATGEQTAQNDQAGLDLAVVTRAAQALSEEIVLPRVIDRLMTDMIVHAGAQYGLLLVMHGDEPLIEATARVWQNEVMVQIATAPPLARALPLSALNTVIRTGKALVHADAYAEAPQLRINGPADRHVRSLICQPLIKRGALVGVLYLENNLAAGVFTPDRTAMLEVLAPQAAISLDAARLYKSLEDENAGRSRAELALRQARAELARTSQLTVMGGLAASIAHEINQPLAGIVSGAEAARRWLDRPQPETGEAMAALSGIHAGALRAAGIVRSLRSLARQTPAAFAPLVIEDVVGEVLRLASTEIDTQQVAIVTRLSPARNVVLADPIQLQQVLFNLVTNGIEAMAATAPADRRLTVETRRAERTVEVSIADTGSGMEPEVLKRIFEPFFTTKQTGMGMGLAICRSILAAHGGTLEAAAAPGAGSRFFFSLGCAG